MSMCLTLQVLLMYCYWCIFCVTGDTVNYYQPFEYRSVPGDMRANVLSPQNSNIFPQPNHVRRQQITRTNSMQSQRMPSTEKLQSQDSDYSFKGILHELNHLAEDENRKLHASYRSDFSPNDDNQLSEGPSRQTYNTWTQPFKSPTAFEAPTSIEEKTSTVLPKFNFLESITTKTSSKLSGLMGLLLSFLNSGSNNLVMKGFKEVIINGILKPLMVAKGGIKVLISKLTIPVISLLLINVEVLITVWWLWDDCPYSQTQHLSESARYNENNYNTTFL